MENVTSFNPEIVSKETFEALTGKRVDVWYQSFHNGAASVIVRYQKVSIVENELPGGKPFYLVTKFSKSVNSDVTGREGIQEGLTFLGCTAFGDNVAMGIECKRWGRVMVVERPGLG